MGSYNPLVFVLGLVTAAGVSGVAYLLAVARGGDEKALGRLYGPLFFTLGSSPWGRWPSSTGPTGRAVRCPSTPSSSGWPRGFSPS